MFSDLDHTADVQLHAWGDTLEEAFEQCAVAMFNYITELDKVEILEDHEIEANGHDMMSLLFHFLDEFLFLFCAEPYLVAKVCFFYFLFLNLNCQFTCCTDILYH